MAKTIKMENSNAPDSKEGQEALAKEVIKLSGKNIEPKFVEMHESDRQTSREIFARRPDISKAQRLLDYNPKVPLIEGIAKVMSSGGIVETWYEPIKIEY